MTDFRVQDEKVEDKLRISCARKQGNPQRMRGTCQKGTEPPQRGSHWPNLEHKKNDSNRMNKIK